MARVAAICTILICSTFAVGLYMVTAEHPERPITVTAGD